MLSDWKISNCTNQLRESIGINRNDLVNDIDYVVKETGYDFIEDSFGNDFSGMSKSLGGGNYLIGFNKDHYWSEKFRRFTIAHELGHLTIPEHRAILEKQTLHRSSPEYNSKLDIEIEADKFAIDFLAPRNTFLQQAEFKNFNSETITILSDCFNISTYATALRFVELTDLSCSLIVNKINGMISYEKRSKRFNEGFKHNFLYKQKIPHTTLTFDFIKKISDDVESEIELNSWYPDLEKKVGANESIIELGYNDYVLTLIEPHLASIEDD